LADERGEQCCESPEDRGRGIGRDRSILPPQPESDLTKRLGSLFFSRMPRRILAC
jgi:hypothetical protein